MAVMQPIFHTPMLCPGRDDVRRRAGSSSLRPGGNATDHITPAGG